MSTSGDPVFDEAGDFLGYHGTGRDITVDVEAAEELRLAKEQAEAANRANADLVTAVSFANDAIIGLGSNRWIKTWNPAAERLYGLRAEDAIGLDIVRLWPGPSQTSIGAALREVSTGKVINNLETTHRRADGHVTDLLISAAPVIAAEKAITGLIVTACDITERKRGEERQLLLSGELQHRTNNLLAVIQSVVGQSLSGTQSLSEARETLTARLHALANANALLTQTEWYGATLKDVISRELASFVARASIDGPPVRLNPNATQGFALVIHELCTNATKYGALSTPAGKVEIRWSVEKRGDVHSHERRGDEAEVGEGGVPSPDIREVEKHAPVPPCPALRGERGAGIGDRGHVLSGPVALERLELRVEVLAEREGLRGGSRLAGDDEAAALSVDGAGERGNGHRVGGVEHVEHRLPRCAAERRAQDLGAQARATHAEQHAVAEPGLAHLGLQPEQTRQRFAHGVDDVKPPESVANDCGVVLIARLPQVRVTLPDACSHLPSPLGGDGAGHGLGGCTQVEVQALGEAAAKVVHLHRDLVDQRTVRIGE